MFFEESDPLDLWPIAAPPLISSWVNLAEKQQHLVRDHEYLFHQNLSGGSCEEADYVFPYHTHALEHFPFLHLNKYIKIHLTSAEHSHSGGCLYIFLINSFYHLTCLCNNFLWPLRLSWLVVLGLYKEDYLQIFKCVPLWLHGLLRIVGRLGFRQPAKPHQLGGYSYPNGPS